MNIAIVASRSKAILRLRGSLINKLVSLNHRVYVLAFDYDNETKKKIIDIGAIPINCPFDRAGLNPLKDLINTVKLTNFFKKLKIDIVFCYMIKPVIYGGVASRLAGIRRSSGMLEGLGYYFTDRKQKMTLKNYFIKFVQIFLYNISLPLYNNLIFLNKDDCFDISKVLFFKLKRKKIHILGGIGVCLNMFRFKKPVVNQVRFIFIGRLLKEKGIFEFLDSAKKLKAKYKDKVKFIVLGGLDKDNPGSVSKDVLTKYMDDGIVEYPGLVENVKEWIEDSSIFVLPSYREGFPRSTQEAMAIGRAVITTDTPGCRDTVVEGQNGFLVEPNNVMALIEKMEFFIENPEQIEKMGKKSREIAENDFNIDLKDRQLIDLILSIR